MNIFFRNRSKSPHELVKIVRDSVARLGSPDRKAAEDISKCLVAMKMILYGDDDTDPSPELVAQLSQEVYNNDLLLLLVKHMALLEFEAKKDVAQIFNNLLRRQIGSRYPTVDYLAKNEDILFTLQLGYENQEVALNCGMILRECARHEPLARILLLAPGFYKYFDYVEVGSFDVASDAFATFRELLTRHKTLVSGFLQENYEKASDWYHAFFECYTVLLNSENYVTKRQSIKLLGEILLDRANFNVMTRYISSADNLKLMMNLLRDGSRSIQFEAFHVFKVFVANPNKNRPVSEILRKNREKLINFLSSFHNDHDDQFNSEKAFLIKQIQEMA
ncbi:Mo25-like protein [Thamnocephalis sphaerospora]|uniref:Mo25-like protein n=1 Tax=Thamnocephalis sphaerospora TaxID=78915 RepID=A0A4P9XXS4_9FUNG|nr:Mo25-like protein [Thamnocephalis sphaerospora]|eukprot:RKP11196.1 Mo25-like protein [Thamnocephalis sphaerospora]